MCVLSGSWLCKRVTRPRIHPIHQVYNVHYSMSINGKVEEGSMEIDAVNNMERFRTGSGVDEAVEVHDFQIVSPTPE